MKPLQIKVMYSCRQCGLRRIEVSVPARECEDIGEWMLKLGCCLSRDHDARSPRCRPPTLTDVMIPIEHADRVGGPSVQ